MTWLAALAFLKRLWAFLKSPGGRAWAGALAIVVVLVLIAVAVVLFGDRRFAQGVAQEQRAEAERLAKAKPAIERVEKGGAAITAQTEQSTQAATERLRVVYRDLIKEIPTYVTPEADRRCDLPVGFVRLHDQAAAGLPQVPEAPGDVRDAPSGIPLSTASVVIVGNYEAGYEWRKRAVACETWAASQADLWDKNIRTASPP